MCSFSKCLFYVPHTALDARDQRVNKTTLALLTHEILIEHAQELHINMEAEVHSKYTLRRSQNGWGDQQGHSQSSFGHKGQKPILLLLLAASLLLLF